MTYAFGDPVRTLIFDGGIGYGTSSTAASSATKKIFVPFPDDLTAGDVVVITHQGYANPAGATLTFELGKGTASSTSADGTFTSFTSALTATGNVSLGTSADRKSDKVEITVTDELVTHFQNGDPTSLTWYKSGTGTWTWAYTVAVYLKKSGSR